MGRACVAAGALHENTALTVSRVVKMCGGCRVRTWYTHHRGRKGFLLYVYLPSCLLYKCTIRATILASTAQITQLEERREEKRREDKELYDRRGILVDGRKRIEGGSTRFSCNPRIFLALVSQLSA